MSSLTREKSLKIKITNMKPLSRVFESFLLVMNNYQAAAAQGYGPPTSPHGTNTRTGFPAANSPGPTIDMYSSNGGDSVSYVQATSPQPSGFPIAVSRAPLNYSPVSCFSLFYDAIVGFSNCNL